MWTTIILLRYGYNHINARSISFSIPRNYVGCIIYTYYVVIIKNCCARAIEKIKIKIT